MWGVILASLGTFFQEVSTLIGKAKVQNHEESRYTMAFLQLFWGALGFFIIASLKTDSFVFVSASLPTFVTRIVLEIIQIHVAIAAVIKATRSSFGFIRTLTIPLILLVDIFLGYQLTVPQFAGITIIVVALFVLFMNHGIEKNGAGLVLYSAVGAVATLSLYKYNITHFNSVVGEQLMMSAILVVYFFILAHYRAKENPLQFLRKPVFLVQSLSNGIGAGFEAFAFAFAPASVIVTAKRASAVLWSVLSGNFYFHEKRLFLKLGGFVTLLFALVLLMF